MRSMSKILTLVAVFALAVPSARAVDINLVNIDLSSPEARRAEQLYGNAYGFPPQQVTPALLAPAEEVPAILQVAQAAGTLPVSVWMMRKMGMSYSNILQSYAVAPLVSVGSPVTDVYYIETTRRHFLTNILQVNPLLIPQIPLVGPEFTRFLIYPVHREFGYWMPPGIAKKYGLWIPPGQAKKMGLWGGPGKGWKKSAKGPEKSAKGGGHSWKGGKGSGGGKHGR